MYERSEVLKKYIENVSTRYVFRCDQLTVLSKIHFVCSREKTIKSTLPVAKMKGLLEVS